MPEPSSTAGSAKAHTPHDHGGSGGWGVGGGAWLVLFTLASWASVPLFLRWFSSPEVNLDPFSANAWRYGISALFWLPLLLIARRRGNVPRSLLVAAIVPAIVNVAGQSAFAWGPALLPPGFFSFIFRVQIIFVALGAYLLFPAERATLRSGRYWLGVAMVVGGSAGLIILKPDRAGFEGSAIAIGVALAAGVLFAGYGLAVRTYVSTYRPVLAFGVICQYTAVGVIAIAAIAALTWSGSTWDSPLSRFTAFQFSMLVASSFIGIALSHVTYYAAIGKLGLAMTAGVIQLQPVVTAVGSLLLFDERLSPAQWAAGGVGVAGALLMLYVGATMVRPKPQPPAPPATGKG